jgi:hypothetical protein
VYGGLQNGVDLGETVPSVCSESDLTVTAGGSEGSNVGVEGFLHMQHEEDHSAVALPAVNASDKVSCECNIVVLTVVQVCTVACAVCCFDLPHCQ